MLRAGLDWGKEAVRGDVQIRLLVGGVGEEAEAEAGRLARLSGVAMPVTMVDRICCIAAAGKNVRRRRRAPAKAPAKAAVERSC